VSATSSDRGYLALSFEAKEAVLPTLSVRADRPSTTHVLIVDEDFHVLSSRLEELDPTSTKSIEASRPQSAQTKPGGISCEVCRSGTFYLLLSIPVGDVPISYTVSWH